MPKIRKQLIFIDDSGDPGFKRASSSNFIMAAALFVDPDVATKLSNRISEYRKSLSWRKDYEFKFSKIRKDIIIELLNIVSVYDFEIYAVYIDKKNFKKIKPIISNEKLYNWTIKELLSIIPVNNAKIEIDGRSSKQNMQKTITYIRHGANNLGNKKVSIKFCDSVGDNLIQLADLIAGSINRSLDKNKTDSTKYIDILKAKIVEIKQIY